MGTTKRLRLHGNALTPRASPRHQNLTRGECGSCGRWQVLQGGVCEECRGDVSGGGVRTK